MILASILGNGCVFESAGRLISFCPISQETNILNIAYSFFKYNSLVVTLGEAPIDRDQESNEGKGEGEIH